MTKFLLSLAVIVSMFIIDPDAAAIGVVCGVLLLLLMRIMRNENAG